MSRPNIILIMTDQQRADTIGALGAPWMKTPHLDRLATEGAAFTECFVTSPVCVGARASLFTGKYPHGCQVFSNFQPWQPTWVSSLADQGYHCVNIGKMHINPYDAPGGFHQRLIMENKDRPLFLEERDRAIYDEWDKALRAHKLTKPSRYNRHAADPEGYKQALGAFEWHLPADMHPDNFIGDTACWWIGDRKNSDPLFLQIGFPGPHPPYDPTPDALAAYADVDLPVPTVTRAELEAQPPAQQKLRDNMIEFNFDSIAWRRDVSQADLLRLRRHYAANVSMIDHQVGRILAALDARGYLDNALVVFTSDHADALGEHGHIQKWTMYDSVVRVPLIFWSEPAHRARVEGRPGAAVRRGSDDPGVGRGVRAGGLRGAVAVGRAVGPCGSPAPRRGLRRTGARSHPDRQRVHPDAPRPPLEDRALPGRCRGRALRPAGRPGRAQQPLARRGAARHCATTCPRPAWPGWRAAPSSRTGVPAGRRSRP
jgi:arylsulfatase